MMKEYKFEPASQMIDVEEGATVNINIVGVRTAYRSVSLPCHLLVTLQTSFFFFGGGGVFRNHSVRLPIYISC